MFGTRAVPQSVRSTLDVIGSYFVDVFYNRLYLNAVDNAKKGKYDNVTDAYCANIRMYIYGCQTTQKHYTNEVTLLVDFYCKMMGINISCPAFEDIFLKQFIPREYFGDFQETQKDEMLKKIFMRTITDFGTSLTKRIELSMIIDNHTKENVPRLQEMVVDIFIQQRDEFLENFAKTTGEKCGITESTVLNGVKKELMTEKYRRVVAETDLQRAKNIITAMQVKIQTLETELAREKERAQSVQSAIQPPQPAHFQQPTKPPTRPDVYSRPQPQSHQYLPSAPEPVYDPPRQTQPALTPRRLPETAVTTPAYSLPQIPQYVSPFAETSPVKQNNREYEQSILDSAKVTSPAPPKMQNDAGADDQRYSKDWLDLADTNDFDDVSTADTDITSSSEFDEDAERRRMEEEREKMFRNKSKNIYMANTEEFDL